MCNIAAAAAAAPNESPIVGHGSTNHQERDDDGLLIGDLVPASVSQLSLISPGTDAHAQALEVLFRYFAARKDSQLPALEEIHLSCTAHAKDAYKEQCARLRAETERTGVLLHLEPYLSSIAMDWDAA